MVDIEADGPVPADYSMVAIGAVLVEPSLRTRFSARLRPVSDRFDPEALAVGGFTREQTLAFEDPQGVMERFAAWLAAIPGRPVLVSDNNGFDAMFVAWYFHHFLGRNPFGHSSVNLGSLYKGLVKDVSRNFKHLRKTAHTHDPLDDALGNAEAMLALRDQGLKIEWGPVAGPS
jgi:hypothetical protein